MLNFLGHYLWWILALLLIAGEMLAPGFFLLWIGIAAAAMGVVMLVFPTLAVLPQAILFVVLAFASCILWWRWLRPHVDQDKDPMAATINRRGERMIGRQYILAEAIENGRGKIRVGDSLWLAEGPDLPAGTEVRATHIKGTTVTVEPL